MRLHAKRKSILLLFFSLTFLLILVWTQFINRTGHETISERKNRILVLYSYYEKNPQYARTLDYFIRAGVRPNDPVDYLFIIQGHNLSVTIPDYSNVKVLRRWRNNCYDFGAYGIGIAWLGGPEFITQYDHIIFINPSAVGPILPKYWPQSLHWSEIFTSRIRGNVHACGASLVCLPPGDLGGWGPRVEGMAFVASQQAVQATLARKVFTCHKSKIDVIVNGEYMFSKVLLELGMNLDSLLLKYGQVDWTDKKNWNCNHNEHPARKLTYSTDENEQKISVHPLETVFFKPVWLFGENVISRVNEIETWTYVKWALEKIQEEYSFTENKTI